MAELNITFFEILSVVRQQIIDHVDLSGVDDFQGSIPEDQIHIEMTSLIHRGKEKRLDQRPNGIIVSPGKVVKCNPMEGENNSDDVHYPVLIQICASEESLRDLSKLKAILKWEQGIRKHFSYQNLRNEVWDANGYVDLVYSPSTDVIDERLFGTHHQMVMGIPLIAVSRGQRSELGSV